MLTMPVLRDFISLGVKGIHPETRDAFLAALDVVDATHRFEKSPDAKGAKEIRKAIEAFEKLVSP